MEPSLLAPEGELAGTVDVPSTVLLLRRAAGTVLVDAGSGPLVGEWPGSGDDLAGALAAAGCWPGSDRPGGADPPRLRPLRGMSAAAGRAGRSACRRRALERGQRARRRTARVGGPAELDRRRRGGVGRPQAALSTRSPQRALAAGGGRRPRPSGGPRAPSAARASTRSGTTSSTPTQSWHAPPGRGCSPRWRSAKWWCRHRTSRASGGSSARPPAGCSGSRSDPAARPGRRSRGRRGAVDRLDAARGRRWRPDRGGRGIPPRRPGLARLLGADRAKRGHVRPSRAHLRVPVLRHPLVHEHLVRAAWVSARGC